MSRKKKLKRRIRERQRKTQERYTAARNHVLKTEAKKQPAQRSERPRKRLEKLKARLKRALVRLFPAEAIEGVVDQIREALQQGVSLEEIVVVLESLERNRPAIRRITREAEALADYVQPAVQAAVGNARLMQCQIDEAMRLLRDLQPDLDLIREAGRAYDSLVTKTYRSAARAMDSLVTRSSRSAAQAMDSLVTRSSRSAAQAMDSITRAVTDHARMLRPELDSAVLGVQQHLATNPVLAMQKQIEEQMAAARPLRELEELQRPFRNIGEQMAAAADHQLEELQRSFRDMKRLLPPL
jgi:hypothetical protein